MATRRANASQRSKGNSARSYGLSGLATAPGLILPSRGVVSLVKREQVGVWKPSIDLRVCAAAPTSLLLLLTDKQRAPVPDTSAFSSNAADESRRVHRDARSGRDTERLVVF